MTLNGRIYSNSADHESSVFSVATLQKLGVTEITSMTRYVGTTKFTGPRIRDLLNAVQAPAGATAVSVVAIGGINRRR